MSFGKLSLSISVLNKLKENKDKDPYEWYPK